MTTLTGQLIASSRPRAVLAELKGAGPVRLLLGAAGLFVIGFGALRFFQDAKDTKPLHVGEWLIGAVIIHDGVIAPVTVAVGWLVARYIPRRARPFIQSGLAIAATVALFAYPFIRRQRKSGPGSALLDQNYVSNLFLILAVIAAVTLACYVVRVIRERSSTAKERPPSVQESAT